MIGRLRDRIDVGEFGCMRVGMQEMRDGGKEDAGQAGAGKEGSRPGGLPDRLDSGLDG